MMRCALYRHFDVDDVLLYVGISERPGARSSGHAADSVWVQFAVREEAVWLDSREEALAAERITIQSEKPLFNRQHVNYDKQPTIDYLARQLKCIQEHTVCNSMHGIASASIERAVYRWLDTATFADGQILNDFSEPVERAVRDWLEKKQPPLIVAPWSAQNGAQNASM
jgi:hypothetical protein